MVNVGRAAPTTLEPSEYRSYLRALLLLLEPVSKNSDDMGYSWFSVIVFGGQIPLCSGIMAPAPAPRE